MRQVCGHKAGGALAPIVVLWLIAAPLGCGGGGATGQPCRPGEALPCTCDDGTPGIRACVDGGFAECQCAVIPDTGQRPADAAGDAASGDLIHTLDAPGLDTPPIDLPAAELADTHPDGAPPELTPDLAPPDGAADVSRDATPETADLALPDGDTQTADAPDAQPVDIPPFDFGDLPPLDVPDAPADAPPNDTATDVDGEATPDAADGGVDLTPFDTPPTDLVLPDVPPPDLGADADLGTPDVPPFDLALPDLPPLDLGTDADADADADQSDLATPDVPDAIDAADLADLADVPDSGPTDLAPDPGLADTDAADADADTGGEPPIPEGLPLITEIQAVNDGSLEDEDGDESDWIELYNPSGVPVDLEGYHLTDKRSDPTLWTFPRVILEPGGYLVVFASEKDRARPRRELHTNFKLASEGEYLALVHPTRGVVQAFDPYPAQLENVSYGLPMPGDSVPLVPEGEPGLYALPDPSWGNDWTALDFDDTAAPWRVGVPGLGYDLTTLPNPRRLVADSEADFSGVQGRWNWQYGYWNLTADGDGRYADSEFTPFPSAGGAFGPTHFFDGTRWNWFGGDPPWTEISATGARPNGANSQVVHWAIRRFVSPVAGTVQVVGTLQHTNYFGDGVVGRIIVDGAEVYRETVFSQTRNVAVTATVAVGSHVDFVIEPGPYLQDNGDQALFRVQLYAGSGETLPAPASDPVADSVADWSPSGVQGYRGWTYGYTNRTSDADGNYGAADFVPFPHDGHGYGPTDYWNGSAYDWYAGNPPWTLLGQRAVHPNSGNHPAGNPAEHWPIRRYEAPYAGLAHVTWQMRKTDANGQGVTGHLFHRGRRVDTFTIAGIDTTGATRPVWVSDVAAGDPIDLALAPQGIGGDVYDTSDSSETSFVVRMLANLQAAIETDLTDELYGVSPGLYARWLFDVESPAELARLALRMRYDDGFVAYLNGHPVASANAPDEPDAAAAATAVRPSGAALQWAEFDLAGARGFLQLGPNVLAIHGLNAAADDDTFLVAPALVGERTWIEADRRAYFLRPTPGAANGPGLDNLGLRIASVTRNVVVEPGGDLPIEARILAMAGPVTEVTLTYRVMYGAETTLAMVDDGVHPDQAGGDGVYTASIPAAATATGGQMLRWYVVALDVAGNRARAPVYDVPAESEQYYGGIVRDARIESDLSVFHWFIENPAAATTYAGTSTSLFYGEEFYDNVHADRHGQSSQGFPKKSYNLEFPADHKFRLQQGLARMRDINLLSNYGDKAKVRNTMAYEIYRDAQADYHIAFPLRVELNGQFWALYDFCEDPSDEWLERIGRPKTGALYKMYDSLVSVSNAEKKTRRFEDKSDLQTLINNLNALSGEALRNYLYDNVNIPAMVNFHAAMTLTATTDCCHKNYYAYRDTEGTGEWWYMPWDVDLSFGHNWTTQYYYYDDRMFPQNPLYVGGNSILPARLFALPEFQQMYTRRVRTLMDQLLQPPGTPPEEAHFEQRIGELYALMGPDAARDYALWTTWGTPQTMEQAIDVLEQQFLIPRRAYMYGMCPEEGATGRILLSGDPGAVSARYFLPGDDSLGTSWTARGFDDSAWPEGPMGIGYDTAPPGYTTLLRTTVVPRDVHPGATAVLTRIRFDVPDPAAVTTLTLRAKYDDGFVAYINGQEVTRRNYTGTPAWNGAATLHDDSAAVVFENASFATTGLNLTATGNVLAIYFANNVASSSDLLLLVELWQGTPASGTLPAAEPPALLEFGVVESQPLSGDPAEAYVQIFNPNGFAVDMTGYELWGAVSYPFRPGTVLPAGGTLYVAASVNAFRARLVGPAGGQGLFVQGDFVGELSGDDELLELYDAAGNLICSQ